MSDSPYQPLAGDDSTVRAKAQHYASIADAITRSVITLKALSGVEGMKSSAIDAIKEKAGSVAEDIDRARARYAETAKALISYSYSLRSAQDAADASIARINDGEESANTAQIAASHAASRAETSPLDEQGVDRATVFRAQEVAVEAGQRLAAAQLEWYEALDTKNIAADSAIRAIVEVVDGKKGNGLGDSWWDNGGSRFYKFFKSICDWAGILSIFLGWVPVLGAVLIALGTIGAILDLIDSVIKTLTEGGSAWDVVGAAAGVALSFVGGKAFAQLAKNIKSASIMKTLPKALGSPATMGRMRDILELKTGESLVPKALDASRTVHATFRSTLESMFTNPLADFIPKSLLSREKHSSMDIMAAFKAAKILPDLNVAKLLDLNQSVVDTAKFIKLNPSVLKDPAFVVGVSAVSAYQVEKSATASQSLGDPATYLNDKIFSLN